MSKRDNDVALRGSERLPLPGARVSGRLNPNERLQVTVMLHPRASDQEKLARVNELAMRLPHERSYLARDEFDAAYGATDEDLAKVEAFARENALDVVEE